MQPEFPGGPARSHAPFDVITTGRAVVDLYPEQHGVGLADVKTFAKYLGGSPTNVAVQAARLGSRTAVVTKVGADGFGEFIRGALGRFGVEPCWVGTHQTSRTPIAFCEIRPPDHFPLLFYREPHAPDVNLTPADFDMNAVRDARVLWTTGTALSAEPSRATILQVLEHRAAVRHGGRRPITIHDIDHRPGLWGSPAEVVSWTRRALEHATAVVGNAEEAELLVGRSDPVEASRALLAFGVELAIVKLGPAGAIARTPERVIEMEAVQVEIVNGLGAGDAFGGALAHGLAHRWSLETALRLANGAGAIAASRVACADDFGTLEEIERLLANRGAWSARLRRDASSR